MRLSLRRQFLFLRGYAITSSLILVVLAAAAFRQASQKTGEITVERVNVVDADGTLRMVLAGKDRMHPGVMDGVTIDRPRPVAGMLFFNDEGDEVGGLTYTGRAAGEPGRDTVRLSELIRKLNAANKLPAGAQREAAVNEIRSTAPPGARRVFVGKTQDKAATMVLADGNGRPRLTLTVDAAGNPRIEFLDEAGKVVARIPEK